jgi:predicted flap endonuclease-1-like 5' DNA nuclease
VRILSISSTFIATLMAAFLLLTLAPAADAKEKVPQKTAAAAPVDVNNASQKDLEALPGIGAATAKKIIAGRPYSSVSDLSKAGVSAKTIAKITPLVTFGQASAPAAAPPAPVEKSAKAGKGARSGATSSPAPPAGAQAQTPPAPGMVWVNTETKVFHLEGDRWYGKTKHGKYMTEADALKAGYRESKEGIKKKQ